MPAISYVGPYAEVEFGDGLTVKRGASIDVPADVAGVAPSGDDPEAEGFDPGSGLLAQPANWVPAKSKGRDTAAANTKGGTP